MLKKVFIWILLIKIVWLCLLNRAVARAMARFVTSLQVTSYGEPVTC